MIVDLDKEDDNPESFYNKAKTHFLLFSSVLLIFILQLALYLVLPMRSEFRDLSELVQAEGSSTFDFKGKLDAWPSRTNSEGLSLSVVGTLGEDFFGRFVVYTNVLPWSLTSRLEKGDRLQAKLRLGKVPSNKPKLFSYQSYLYRKGYLTTARVQELQIVETVRNSFYKKLIDTFGKTEELGLLLALTAGNKTLLSLRIKDLFQKMGIAHILVVSGFHIGVLYWMCSYLLKQTLGKVPSILIHIPRQWFVPVLSFVFICLYQVIIGYSLTVSRALLVLFFHLVSKLCSRELDGGKVILLSLFICQLVWPLSILNLGTQLTFSAVLGLLIASRFIRKEQNFFYQSFIFSMGASFFTWPVLYLWFSKIPLFAPVYNTFLTPLFSIIGICMGGFALGMYYLGFPFAELLLSTVLFLLRISIEIADKLF